MINWLKMFGVCLGLLASGAALAQGIPDAGVPVNRSTINLSAKMTATLQYQQVLPNILGTSTPRQALTIQNNNASDSCYLVIGQIPLAGVAQITNGVATTASITVNGVSVTAIQASILLTAGGSYNRYWPYVPSDAIYAACANSGDSLYVETQ